MELTDTAAAATVGGGFLIVLGRHRCDRAGDAGSSWPGRGAGVGVARRRRASEVDDLLALHTFLALLGVVTKYLVPGRSLRTTGVPTRSLLAGVGWPSSASSSSRWSACSSGSSWACSSASGSDCPGRPSPGPPPGQALKAVGVSILIELFFALTIAVVWVFGLVLIA